MFVEYNGKKYNVKNSLKLQNLGIKKITDINGLDKLTSLKKLDLDHNEIEDIDGLENLKELEYLSLMYNKIKEIKGLEHLSNLKKLFLGGNPVFDSVKEKEGKNYYNYAQYLVEYCQKETNIIALDKFTEQIKKVLIFELEKQRPITKGEMLRDLDFDINTIEQYFKGINKNIGYGKNEKQMLKNLAEKVLKTFPKPTLYDLIVSFNINYDQSKKLGKYLVKEGWINEFSNIPKKVPLGPTIELKEEKVFESESKEIIEKRFCLYCGEILKKELKVCPHCETAIKLE